MKYMGSKARHSKELLPIILEGRKVGQFYVEPFVGGFNMIDKVDGNRIANDINPYLTSLFLELQKGWIPPLYISESEYNTIRKNLEQYSPHLIGYVGFNSYGAKFFGGYRRDSIGKRDYWKEHYNNIIQQSKRINGVEIRNENYLNLTIPPTSIVYCDPPYEGTTGYNNLLDYGEFWQWVRDTAIKGNQVFVSEYNSPRDFISVWKKEVNNTLGKNTGSKQGVEQLFVYNP